MTLAISALEVTRPRLILTDDTIYAVATGAGRAAVAIIRVSGPAVPEIARAVAGRLPPPREATLMRLRDPATHEMLDRALVLFFAAPRSETGEDCLEFHLHGGPAVIAGVLAVLGRMPTARQAEPGEFARRAFANGKMDLAQVEGLADLVDAETHGQRRQAQRQLSGAMRDATAPWRAALIKAAALIETAIDFSEDVELETSVQTSVAALMAPVRVGLQRELAAAPAAERMRDGVQVVIAGPPNAGKSTLLNALIRRDAAIVSAVAGTTRDPIEVYLDLDGCPVMLIDTAGLRESADTVERIGIFRARERAAGADLVLWLSDGEAPPAFDVPVWRLAGKADLGKSETSPLLGEVSLRISAKTGENLDILQARLTTFAQERTGVGASGVVARERHRLAFAAALDALDALKPDLPVEIIAEHLRAARFALERLIGSVDVEDILSDVFSRFCIGK